MSAYSSNLRTYASRLNGFSRTNLKIPCMNSTGAAPGGQIICDLPTGLLDLSTLTLWAKVSTSTGVPGTPSGYVALPKHGISGLIQRMEIESSGGIVSSIAQSYNQIYTMMAQLQGFDDTPAANTSGAVLEGSQNLAAPPTANLPATQYAVKRWLGFLGSVKPDVFPTDLAPLRIRITLDGAYVLASSVVTPAVAASGTISAAPAVLATNPTFTLSDIFFTCDAIDIADGLFQVARMRFLQGGGLLEMPFSNYFQSTAANTGQSFTHRWNCSSRSLDYVFSTLLPQGYNTAQATYDPVLQNSSSFVRTVVDTVGSVSSLNLTLNSVPATAHRPTPAMAFGLTQSALGLHSLHDIMPASLTAATWPSKYFTWVQSYCNTADPGERISSGLSTAGSQVVGALEVIGSGGSNTSWVTAQCTSLLQVGANGYLNVIQ